MTVVQNDELKVVVSIGMPGTTIAQNVFYARYTALTEPTDAVVANDMLLWVDEMYENLDGQMGPDVFINEVITYKKITAVPLVFQQIGSEESTEVGTSATETLPNGVAMVMRIGTVALRSIARKYIAGLSEENVLTVSWSSTALVQGALFLIDWIAGPPTQSGRTYEAGIVSAKDGLFKTFLSIGTLSIIPGYQRRRKPGVGV